MCRGHYSTRDTRCGGWERDAEGASRGVMPVAQGLSLRNAQRMRQNLPTDTADQGIPRILPADQGIPGIRSPLFALSRTSGGPYEKSGA
jgi:hypothetical protein